jgi:thiol-disulfide isomerase/thioredoxin
MFHQQGDNNMSNKIFFAAVAVIALAAVIYAVTMKMPAPASVSSNTSLNEPNATVTEDMIPANGAKQAPELKEGEWINSEPLTLEKLKGRVVLVDFWTFGCYNCRNTLPALKKFDEKYREQGLTIIGVHTPEFDYEKETKNVRSNVNKLGIKYAVVTDNEYETWEAYNVHAWPSVFILDKQGRIRFKHVGEGRYDDQEQVIKILLAEK